MAAKHSIKAEYTNDYGQKTIECSCGALIDGGSFEAHLIGEHKADLAKQEREAALKAARDWNKA